ncbi:MAG TPA: sulfatase-like hydrolase/transferase [Vicinamibacterales bacterium]
MAAVKRVVLAGLAVIAVVTAFIVFNQRSDGVSESHDARTVRRLSVLLITIDTLRADRVGRGLTPAIDELARRGTAYTSVRAAAPLTLPSHVSLLTGTLPPTHGVRENGVVFDGQAPTIARAFKDAGYRTAAFVGAYVLNRRFGLDDGFDTYDDAVHRDMDKAELLEAERSGGEVVDAALNWLRPDGPPFFLWVHMYDPHAPYAPPVEYLEKAGGQPYDGEVAYADAQAGRVIAALRERGWLDRTIVAVAGDHGEGLGDHAETTHGMLAYDSTLRVPLVVVTPGAAAASDDTPMSLAELGPRLLHTAGLRDAFERLPVYSETIYPRRAGWHALSTLADEQWKLIRSSEPELYEIDSDPSETTNVAAAHPNIVQAMTAAIDRVQAGAKTGTTVSADAAERLRALGYVSGSAAARPDDSKAPNPARTTGAWTRFERALSQVQAGEARAAVPVLKALASEYPDAPVFQSTYARALKDAGDLRAAVKVYKAAVARWPDDPALFHDLAVAARDAGDLAEAARAEQAALALDDTSAMAQNGLGLVHADAGRFGEAAAAFDRAARLDPTNASYWSNLGNARSATGDARGAEAAYQQALESDAEFADALNGLGTLRVQAGRFAEAIPYFERALKRDPQFQAARLNLGIALHESGQHARAREVYRELLATAPGSAKREREAAAELLKGLR